MGPAPVLEKRREHGERENKMKVVRLVQGQGLGGVFNL